METGNGTAATPLRRYKLYCGVCGQEFFDVEEGDMIGYSFECCNNPQILMKPIYPDAEVEYHLDNINITFHRDIEPEEGYYHRNVRALIELERVAIDKGWNEKHPGEDFCRVVAEISDELGNAVPSNKAIINAMRLIEGLNDEVSK